MSLVNYTFFKTRPKCGEFKLYPLTAGRLIILEERGNVLATKRSEENADVPVMTMYEALMVASTDSEALAEVSLLEDHDWQLEVRKFSFDCSDEAVGDFEGIFMKEMEAVQKKMVKPIKKRPGKKASKRARKK